MMNSYDKNLPLAYSPGEKFSEVQDEYRVEVIGGITIVFRRDINLEDEDSPWASRYTNTNERFTYFGFFDFNAMYPSCMRKKMPLTAGIFWDLKDGTFVKKQMLEVEQISFPHLQWIYYRQAIDGYDNQGQFVQIEHAYHRGEKSFEGLKPDGYLFKNGKHYFYEFQGNLHQLFQ